MLATRNRHSTLVTGTRNRTGTILLTGRTRTRNLGLLQRTNTSSAMLRLGGCRTLVRLSGNHTSGVVVPASAIGTIGQSIVFDRTSKLKSAAAPSGSPRPVTPRGSPYYSWLSFRKICGYVGLGGGHAFLINLTFLSLYTF